MGHLLIFSTLQLGCKFGNQKLHQSTVDCNIPSISLELLLHKCRYKDSSLTTVTSLQLNQRKYSVLNKRLIN